ncbi:MAG TPA: SDR family oxidoreductase [Gemmatimonadaceae bacterium]|nr:SDR family oxidoreductase [Gemmatimonadaceae bacterium]
MPVPAQHTIAAVVTGHTRGLGAAIAAHLLARGIRVLGIARNGNAELGARYPDSLVQAELDLGHAAAFIVWLRRDIVADFVGASQVALLINNAGVVQPVGPLDTQDPEVAARAVVLNVAAPLALSAAFVRATGRARERRILHISSGAGRNAYSGWSVYCASKAALDHHARAVTLDRTPRLRIASVAPGVIDTDMQTEIRATSEREFPDRQRFVRMKEEGELLSPDRAGSAVVEHLLSDAFGREPTIDLRYRGR